MSFLMIVQAFRAVVEKKLLQYGNFHAIFTILSLIVDVACGKELLTTWKERSIAGASGICIINHFPPLQCYNK